MLRSEVQRVCVTGSQQVCFSLATTAPDWSYGMDHMPSLQSIAFRDLGLTCFTTFESAALRQQQRPGSFMDGTIHPTTAEEGGVGGVDNGVHVESGNVGLEGFD